MTWRRRSIADDNEMKYPYSLLIQWSDEDQLYLVTLPEFAEFAMQPSTYGQTYEDAVKNAQGFAGKQSSQHIPIRRRMRCPPGQRIIFNIVGDAFCYAETHPTLE